MRSLGFIARDDDWLLIPSLEAWEVLVECRRKLEKFLQRLDSAAVVLPESQPAATATPSNPPPDLSAVHQLLETLTVLSTAENNEPKVSKES